MCAHDGPHLDSWPPTVSTVARFFGLCVLVALIMALSGNTAFAAPIGWASTQLSLDSENVTVAWDAVGGNLEGNPQPESAVVVASSTLAGGVSEPQVVSEAGDSAELIGLATDAAGDVLVTWHASREYRRGSRCVEGCKYHGRYPFVIDRGTWYAWRSAGGSFSSPALVAPISPEVSKTLVAMNDGGYAIIAYEMDEVIYVRWGNARGEFRSPIAVVGGGRGLAYVGLDAAGEAMLVTEDECGVVGVTFGLPDRRFAPLRMLARSPCHETPGKGNLVAAIGNGGNALVAWGLTEERFEGTYLAYRPAHRNFGPMRRLSEVEPLAASAASVRARLVLENDGFKNGSTIRLVEADARGLSRATALEREPAFGGMLVKAMAQGDGTGDLIVLNPRTSPETEPESPHASLLVRLRRSASGGAFRPPEILETFLPGESDSELEQAALATRDGSFAIASLAREASSARTGYGFLRVRQWRPVGESPADLVPLIAPPPAEPVYAPASVLELGQVARPDARGALRGRLSCGTEEPGACSLRVEIVSTAAPHAILASTTLAAEPGKEPRVAVPLTAAGRSLLAKSRRVHAEVRTMIRSGRASPTEMNFPLTIAGTKKPEKPVR
jgi:hypothetical protein